MDDLTGVGRLLLLAGVVLAVLGGLLVLLGKAPGAGDWLGWLGRLPGDMSIKRDNVSFYFPLATSILISVVLSLLFYLFGLFGKR